MEIPITIIVLAVLLSCCQAQETEVQTEMQTGEHIEILTSTTMPRKYTNESVSEPYIRYINNVQRTWKAGKDFVGDTTWQQLYSLVSGQIPPDLSAQTRTSHAQSVEDLPKSFDAVTKWPECRSVIERMKDKSKHLNCVTGWAVSAAATIADRTCIASKGAVKIELSVEDILSCCEGCSTRGNGCLGGDIVKLWKHWVAKGFTTTKCKPERKPTTEERKPPEYDEVNCKSACVDENAGEYKKSLRLGKDYYVLPQVEKKIQAEIMTNGPVQAEMAVNDDIFLYIRGVYKNPQGPEVGRHSMKMTGWGEEDGEPYWDVTNYWGEKYGLMGKIKIARGINLGGIESSIVAGLPANDTEDDKSASAKISACSVIILLMTASVVHFCIN